MMYKTISENITGNKPEKVTELVFILDRSGSMSGLECDTIGGFNAMINKQRKQKGKVLVSTVLFDDETRVLHDRIEIQKIPQMSEHDYTVGGCTALFDAIGGAIHHIGTIHKYARPEDVPAHTMFIITTDGMENASRHYNSDQIRQMIQRQKTRYGWEFLFLGANIDAVETAKNFGIEEERAVTYECDAKGTALNYEAIGEAITTIRCNARLDRSWKEKIEEDHRKRGKKNRIIYDQPE